MEPEARELRAGRPFALRDLVLVVGEDQVHPARVDVDRRLAEQPQRHRRALDVPPGPARTDPGVPGGLAFLRRFPEHEVARVFLLVLVGVDARAALDAGVIEVRELAVGGERGDLEVDGPVAPVGVAVLFERLDRRGHGLDVVAVGRARRLFHRLEAERRRVLVEDRDVAVRVLAQRHAGLLRLEDGAVVHVGEVHDLADGESGLVLQRAAKDVNRDEGAEVADVPARVGGQAARVHPHEIVAGRDELLFTAGQRVVQAHQGIGYRRRAADDRDSRVRQATGNGPRRTGCRIAPQSAAPLRSGGTRT